MFIILTVREWVKFRLFDQNITDGRLKPMSNRKSLQHSNSNHIVCQNREHQLKLYMSSRILDREHKGGLVKIPKIQDIYQIRTISLFH